MKVRVRRCSAGNGFHLGALGRSKPKSLLNCIDGMIDKAPRSQVQVIVPIWRSVRVAGWVAVPVSCLRGEVMLLNEYKII
jgi:hypothetical protein